MKLWIKVFLLSSIMSLAAILTIGITGLRGGYQSVLNGAVDSLIREKGNATAVIDKEWKNTRSLGEAFPGNELIPPESTSDLPSFLRAFAKDLFYPGIQIELRTVDGSRLFTSGNLFGSVENSPHPEVDQAADGKTAYILRRIDGTLSLFLSAPAQIQNTDLLISVAVSFNALDDYRKRQLIVVVLSSMGASVFLLALSYAGSRAIARRLEELAARTEAISRGDYSGRASEKGGDEVAALAVRINRMAHEVESTVRSLREEKEDRQRFIDDLTHEIRTPVTSIVGFADLLRVREWDQEVFSRGLERIRDEGKRMLALVDGLKRMLLARAAEREFPIIEAGPLLNRVAAAAGDRLAARSKTLSVEAAPGSVPADPELLETALLNFRTPDPWKKSMAQRRAHSASVAPLQDS